MIMRRSSRIANRDVPIEPGEPITVRFSGGRAGASEAGTWEFWNAFNGIGGVTARCRQGSDPGERFRRMERKREYEGYWKVAAAAKGIRPATQAEVVEWLNIHKEDLAFAESCQIEGKTMSVVRTANGVQFEQISEGGRE